MNSDFNKINFHLKKWNYRHKILKVSFMQKLLMKIKLFLLRKKVKLNSNTVTKRTDLICIVQI
jgi:hypothetical protein